MAIGTAKKQRSYRKREATPEAGDEVTTVASTSTAVATTDGGSADANDKEPANELSLDELLEIRKLRQRSSGIAAADLMIGDTTLQKKKKKEKAPAAADPWKLSSGGGLIDLDEVRRSDESTTSKPVSILSAFTQQTNALDIDKHLMKYIDDEMRKRKGENASKEDEDQEEVSRGKGKSHAYNADADILDQMGIRRKPEQPEQEGNVQLSTTMLTAIPEVDLGIDARLKNIEETEKAKRKMMEARAAQHQQQQNQNQSGAERFSQPSYVPSDRERISHHQQNNRRHGGKNNNNNNSNNFHHNNSNAIPNHRFQNTGQNPNHNNKGPNGRGMATDDIVMERFKKRMRR